MTKHEDLRKEFLAIAELRLVKVEEIRELLSISPAASIEEVLSVSLSTACLPTDSPCRTRPDDWYTLANRRPHCLARTRRGGLRHSSLRNWLNRERAASDAGTAAQKESGPIALRGRKVETPKSSLYAA